MKTKKQLEDQLQLLHDTLAMTFIKQVSDPNCSTYVMKEARLFLEGNDYSNEIRAGSPMAFLKDLSEKNQEEKLEDLETVGDNYLEYLSKESANG